MARQEVVLVRCDRCKREELRPAGTVNKTGPDFEYSHKGTHIVYNDLCESCSNTIAYHVNYIKEWERDIKSKMGPKIDPNTAPPTNAAPDYTPPKPHSLSAVKR